MVMRPEDILCQPAKILTSAQREAYFRDGYLAVERLVPDEWLARLRELSAEFLEASKAHTKSNEAFDLGSSHSADRPHVRRLRALVDRHPDFWRFTSERCWLTSPLTWWGLMLSFTVPS